MKAERLQTALWAYLMSLCLGLGAVGAMATGLGMSVSLKTLSLCCILLGAAMCPFLFFKHGIWLPLAAMAGALFSHSLRLQLKTVVFYVLQRLQIGYGFPIPGAFQGELAPSVLPGLCLVSGVIMLLCDRAVVRGGSCFLPVLVSAVPLMCCVTVVDTVPKTLWLILWLTGLVLLVLTQTTRRRSEGDGNKLCLGLALPTVAAVLLLFWLIPRDAPQRWQLSHVPQQLLSHFTGIEAPTGQGGTVPGYTAAREVDLTDLGPRSQELTAIGQVTAGFSGRLYLRIRDYDTYSGLGWSASEGRSEELYGFTPQWHEKDGTVKLLTYQPRDHYLVPAYTQQVQLLKGGMAENPLQERSYSFDYCRLQEGWEQYWQENDLLIVNPRYLALPDEVSFNAQRYLKGAGQALADALKGLSKPEQARKIAAAVRATVPYDLNTPNMSEDSRDLAYWFLTEAESGYCVHYATAAAVLLRESGIPCRYVEGYAVHVQKGRAVTVQERHAHAWVEYYLQGVGWVVLESTPGTEEEPEQPTEAPTEEVTQPQTTEPSQAPTEDTSVPTEDPQEQKPRNFKLSPWVKTGLWLLLGIAAGAALLIGQYRLRRWLLKQRCRNDLPNQRGLAIFRQLKRVLRLLKEPVPDSLIALAQKARFSHHKLTVQELKALQTALSEGERALKEQKLMIKLVAKWLLALY